MEPNKFETQFREKLNSREIKPSEMAWNKLDAMLSVSEKPKRKNFSWIYIAASFIGFLLIGTAYFSQIVNSENQKNNVVIQQPDTTNATKIHVADVNSNTEDEKSIATSVVRKSTLKSITSPVLKEESIILKNNSNQNAVVQVSIINQKSEQKTIRSQTAAVKVDELLTAVENVPKSANQLNQKQVVHVNASNLLSQVDGELELSFREKVINKVSKNYKTVKVALANRNLE